MHVLNQKNRQFAWSLAWSLSLFGCSTTTALDEKRAHTIQMCKQNLPASDKIKLQAVSTGCIASFAVSKAIGSNNPAPLICMAGGASGFLLGESIAERKCAYVTQADQLKGEIAHAKQMNTGFAMILAQQATELAAFELMLTGLKQQQAAQTRKSQQQQALEASLNEQIAKDQLIYQQVQEEFRFKQKTLAASKRLKPSSQEADLRAEIQALQKNLKQLQASHAKFTRLRQSLNEE